MASISIEKPMARDTTTAAPTPGESTCAGEAAMLGGQRIKGSRVFKRREGAVSCHKVAHTILLPLYIVHYRSVPRPSQFFLILDQDQEPKDSFIDRGHLLYLEKPEQLLSTPRSAAHEGPHWSSAFSPTTRHPGLIYARGDCGADDE